MPGAYGFSLVGADRAGDHLVETEPGWPTLVVERRTGPARPTQTVIGRDAAEIELVAGGRLSLRREPLEATFTTQVPITDDALVHPYLAPAAAVGAYWLGREALHAGAIRLRSGAWGIVSHKEGGKSSLLASLALGGIEVLADDAVITEGLTVFAGPRSVDLRAESAERLGAGEPLGRVGDRDRWRLRLGPVAGTAPLRGWVFLSWGDTVRLTPAAAGDRLQRLLGHRIVKGLPPPHPVHLLDLSALPGFELRRPRVWSQLDAAGSLLAETLSSL